MKSVLIMETVKIILEQPQFKLLKKKHHKGN